MRLGVSLAAWLVACGPRAPADHPQPAAPADAGPTADAAVAYRAHLRVVEPPAGTGALPGSPRVAARVFAFSDSQLHYLFGKRTFAQSPFADMSVEVAVRPAALDDGSDLLLDLFLTERAQLYADHELVFLGDAADLSCTQEYRAFFDRLATAGIENLLAVTSNHDGFYVGNFTSKRDLDGRLQLTDMPNDWSRACSDPGSFDDNRLTKGRAVAELAQRLPAGEPWATDAVHAGAEGPDDYTRTHLYYVRPLAGGDAGVAPAWGVFLDTVDYRDIDLPSTRGAGTVGAVSHEQLKFLDVAMFNARTGGDTEVSAFVLFGHHPYSSLDAASRERLAHFIDVHPRIVGYVSAHTHVPKELSIDLPSGRSVPELVVGSTTDAPQQARRLEVQLDPEGGGRAALASWRLVVDGDALCSGVEPMPPTTLGYTGYRILRDATGQLDVSAIEKLLVFLSLDDLEVKRAVQGVGALVVENELVRAWAELYLGAPFRMSFDRGLLQEIVDTRYAAGDDFAALEPWLRGAAKPAHVTRYSSWHDPVVASYLTVAEQGVYRFGPHLTAFQELREKRHESAASERYFLCHAIYAGDAEERSRRKVGDVLYVR